MRLGDLEFHILNDGFFRLDGGAMFGVVPKPLWAKKFPADDRNRILMGMNCILVRTAGKWVLIETGAGNKWDAKQAAIYDFHGQPRLIEQLAQRGLQPADIDIVINTHLHFDHCGWNTTIVDGKAVPTFPNATYVLQKDELDHAKHPTERDRASYFPDNFLPVEKAGQFRLLEGDAEVAPGVECIRLPGHNRDMQGVRLSGGGKTAMCFVDLIPTTAHIPFPWIMAYDLYPLTTLENKKKWIPEAARNEWICIFSHDPHIPLAYIREHDGKYEPEPIPIA